MADFSKSCRLIHKYNMNDIFALKCFKEWVTCALRAKIFNRCSVERMSCVCCTTTSLILNTIRQFFWSVLSLISDGRIMELHPSNESRIWLPMTSLYLSFLLYSYDDAKCPCHTSQEKFFSANKWKIEIRKLKLGKDIIKSLWLIKHESFSYLSQ